MMRLTPDMEPVIDEIIDDAAKKIRAFMEASGKMKQVGELAAARMGRKVDLSAEFNEPELFVSMVAIRTLQRIAQKSETWAAHTVHSILDAIGAYDQPVVEEKNIGKFRGES